jgi:hypothetical protein
MRGGYVDVPTPLAVFQRAVVRGTSGLDRRVRGLAVSSTSPDGLGV